MVVFLLVFSKEYQTYNTTDQFFEICFSSNDPDLSDRFILDIAPTVPHAKYFNLGVKLGFTYNHVDSVLAGIATADRYEQATTKILMEWKDKHGTGPDQKKQLVDILASLGIKTSEGEKAPAASIFPSGMVMIKCR